MTCWFCGGEMMWQSDYDFEDYEIDGNGYIAVLTCSECNAFAEFYTGGEEEKEESEG